VVQSAVLLLVSTGWLLEKKGWDWDEGVFKGNILDVLFILFHDAAFA